MQPVPEHIDELIACCLAGDASAAQLEELEQWKLADPLHAKYYDQCALIFSSATASVKDYNTDAAWKKVQGKMQDSSVKQLPVPVSFEWKQVLRIAAVLLMVAGIGWWINNLQSPAELVAVISEDKVLHDTLSDGSTIDLNKKSSLSYSSDFGKKHRRVQLKGEAFFNVRHDDALPFVVETKGVLIKDIGTAFNVFAPEDSSIVRVSVEEGTVHFFVEGSTGVMLEKGQAAEYNSATGVITRLANMNPAESAYRNGILRFNNAHLSEVAVALQKLYGVPVVMESGLEDCLITVTFTNESLETVLNIIAETLNFQYVREENRILLKGSGCRN